MLPTCFFAIIGIKIWHTIFWKSHKHCLHNGQLADCFYCRTKCVFDSFPQSSLAQQKPSLNRSKQQLLRIKLKQKQTPTQLLTWHLSRAQEQVQYNKHSPTYISPQKLYRCDGDFIANCCKMRITSSCFSERTQLFSQSRLNHCSAGRIFLTIV